MLVVLFDGTCNLCNGAVQFIVDHERDHALSFASLQSDEGRTLLEASAGEDLAKVVLGGASGDPTTIVLVEDDKAYTDSTAALRIAKHLRWYLSWAYIGIVIPRGMRDAVYRFIARNRYRWFGKTQSCRVPTPELRARFLATPPAEAPRV